MDPKSKEGGSDGNLRDMHFEVNILYLGDICDRVGNSRGALWDVVKQL